MTEFLNDDSFDVDPFEEKDLFEVLEASLDPVELLRADIADMYRAAVRWDDNATFMSGRIGAASMRMSKLQFAPMGDDSSAVPVTYRQLLWLPRLSTPAQAMIEQFVVRVPTHDGMRKRYDLSLGDRRLLDTFVEVTFTKNYGTWRYLLNGQGLREYADQEEIIPAQHNPGSNENDIFDILPEVAGNVYPRVSLTEAMLLEYLPQSELQLQAPLM